MGQNANNIEKVEYRTLEGDKVLIELEARFLEGISSASHTISIEDVSAKRTYEHEFEFRANSICNDPISVKSMFDFSKDLILTGNWRTGEEETPYTWEQMKTLGWHTIKGGIIGYVRNVDSLASEGSLARWLILRKMYLMQERTLPPDNILKDLHFPMDILRREFEVLRDLRLIIEVNINDFRLSAAGRKFFEEHELPAHNLVFIIAPCTNKYMAIRDAYQKIAEGEEFGYKTKFQEATTTKEATIRDDILANIRACKFVIADITGRGEIETVDAEGIAKKEFERLNYNCIYELGYAHALNKKLVCFVSREMGFKAGELKLPFDFAAVQFDDWEINNVKEFKEKLRKRLRDIQEQFQREYWPETK
jgi:hypothetical protein